MRCSSARANRGCSCRCGERASRSSATWRDARTCRSRTSAMILPVGVLIERLSAICPLLPGDLIFTGTPAGVGMGRNPEKYLKAGDEVVSRIEGIGEIRQRCVA